MEAKKTINLINFILLGALIAATIVISILLSKPENRDSFFGLSIGILIFCELLTFGFSLYYNNVKDTVSETPLLFALMSSIKIYDIITILIVILFWGLIKVTIEIYITAHIINFIVSLFIGGTFTGFMASAKEADKEIATNKNRINMLSINIDSIVDVVHKLSDMDDLKDVDRKLNELSEKIKYSDPMTHPQISDLEGRISENIIDAEEKANLLTKETVNEFIKFIDEIQYMIDKRNKMILTLKK